MMIIAAWISLSALSCCAHALAPPVASALEPPTSDSGNGENLSVPDKRILKYLLPSSQSWGESGANAPMPTGQEGSKRGYVDRNFLRFGRSEGMKRDAGRNFLRFGRDGGEDYEDDEYSSPALSADKRDRNFLRFGRDSGKNFPIFGRPDLEEFGLDGSPLAFGQGLKEEEMTEEDKRASHKNFLRFGRGNKNFLRFGRNYNKNFLRFGRSVDAQTSCDDCEDEENISKHSTTSSTSSSSHGIDNNNKHSQVDEAIPSEVSDSSAVSEERDIRRSKRSAPMYYDYAVVPSHSPASWAREFQPAEEEEVDDADLVDLQDVSKRNGYNRNFLRFGRDRNFLRFGKREPSDASSVMVMAPVQYPRIIRASNRNFLRFG